MVERQGSPQRNESGGLPKRLWLGAQGLRQMTVSFISEREIKVHIERCKEALKHLSDPKMRDTYTIALRGWYEQLEAARKRSET